MSARWEYAETNIPPGERVGRWLTDHYGADGWEVVSVHRDRDGIITSAFLKRPLDGPEGG